MLQIYDEVVDIQPVFSEFIRFLSDKGCDTAWFRERTFWLDRNIIKAYVSGGGGLVSLYKMVVDDKLNVTLTRHKQNKDGLQFETWDETIARKQEHLNELEAQSISVLQQHCSDQSRRIINTNSTGKDSMVVTHLAKKAGLSFETYFNVTTLDVAQSNRMAKRNGFIPIVPRPEYGGFYSYIQRYESGGLSK